MLMHTLGRMLYIASQMNLVLHCHRKSSMLYGKLPILRKKTSMLMLMHENSLILSCPMFGQLCFGLYFHWEDSALYSLEFYNHERMTSIPMLMHGISLNKTIYIVSRLHSVLRFHRKSSMVCSFLTISEKVTSIFMLMHRILSYSISCVELWSYFNLYSNGIPYIISRLHSMEQHSV